MKIAFQGERGAYGERAALSYFGERAHDDLVAYAAWEDVFDSVASGDSEFGVVPIENSLAGSVRQNYDLLCDKNVSICGEIYLPIHHMLLTRSPVDIKEIKRVYSHPQALAQCSGFLKKHPRIEQVASSNTAAAAKFVAEKGQDSDAASASEVAAEEYSLKIIKKNIENFAHNTTRFLILGPRSSEPVTTQSCMRTSIVFSLENRPGALVNALSLFSGESLDLFKIESRPAPTRGFDYLFYLDFKGNAAEEPSKSVLGQLAESAPFYRCLGIYPCGTIDPDNRTESA